MNILQFGDGKWGQNHKRILGELGHKVTTLDIDLGWDFVKEYRIENAKRPVDAVLITTSSVNHFPILSYMIQHGIPVFCEKPVLLQEWQLGQLKYFTKVFGDSIFMSGHQLVFMDEIGKFLLSTSGDVVYMNSMRAGGIPREEGALLSLMVHDIALAHYTLNEKNFECVHAEGNKHELRATLVSGNKQVDLYAVSVSKVRFRDTVFIKSNGEKLAVRPDNWNRPNLLKEELEMFIRCVDQKIPCRVNGFKDTIQIMETVFKIQKQLDATKQQ